MYKQCKLKQNTTIQTAWIPLKGAVLGYTVELKDGTGLWNVIEVYPQILREDDLKQQQRLNRNSFSSI